MCGSARILKGGVLGIVALLSAIGFAEDVDLTAEIRAAYVVDTNSVTYTDGGHYSATTEPITAYTAFDGITKQRWLSPDSKPNYLQIELPVGFNDGQLPGVKSVKMYGIAIAGRAPKSVRFSVSNDGFNYSVCAEEASLTFSSQTATFEVPTPLYGRFLRLDILQNAGGDRHNINEVYYYGTFGKPLVAVCQGRDASGKLISGWEYPLPDADGKYVLSRSDITVGASKFTCIGYKLETSTDGGQTWATTMSAETSLTINPAADTTYRVTWRWTESSADGATVIHVSPTGDGSDGSSWAKAYQSLEQCSLADKTFVKIAGGRYTMDTGVTIDGLSGVTLSGGWNPSTDTCDPSSNPTYFTTSAGHAGVVLSVASASRFRMSDIRFLECINNTSSSAALGTALNLATSTTNVFERCSFRNCIAQSTAVAATAAAKGGAVYIQNSSAVSFTDCDFGGNRAQTIPSDGVDKSENDYITQGGAVAQYDCEVQYVNCRFIGNQCVSMARGTAGGGVYAHVNSAASNRDKKATFRGCVFLANQVNQRRASIFLTRSGVALRNVTEYISGSCNPDTGSAVAGYCLHLYDSAFAANKGTAIRFSSASSTTISICSIMNCQFRDQLHNWYYDPRLETVTITDCSDCSIDDLAARFTTSDLYVSPTGNDAASGAASAPLKTVTAALAKAENGTTIHLASGTYGDGETFPLEIRGRAFLKLAGEKGAVIDATSGVNSRVLDVVDSAYATISNVKLTGGHLLDEYGRGGGVMCLASGGTRFDHAEISGNSAMTSLASGGDFYGGGICVASGDATIADSLISSNIVGQDGYQANACGFGVCAITSSLIIERSRFTDNRCEGNLAGQHGTFGAGLYSYNTTASGDRLRLVNSVFDNNIVGSGYTSQKDRMNGLAVYTTGDAEFVNCTMISNRWVGSTSLTGRRAINNASGLVLAFTNCVSIGHAEDFPSVAVGIGNAYGSMTSSAADFGTVITDPLFKSGTFIPLKESPLVDAGVDVGWTNHDRDIYGAKRVFGEAVDIGAAEMVKYGMVLLLR